uniref:PiggyBac transposable element-derived protein 4-like n=1 Tax=Saccoglossus kowalevskii TaxID=10224 RepID=A0ABM0LX75_SACKO|nr:PREDICTED: piggyBac transposable element-derived protein 4-like [Saccoglossus kowalevskii]
MNFQTVSEQQTAGPSTGMPQQPADSELSSQTDRDAILRFFDESDSDTEFKGFTVEEIDEGRLRCELLCQNTNCGSDIDPNELLDLLNADSDSDSDADDSADTPNIWSNERTDVNIQAHDDQFSGPRHGVGFDGEPLDFFKLYFTDDFLDLLVGETNKYARHRQEVTGRVDRHWYEMDRDEMSAYFGVIILMRIHPLPEVPDYWSSDDRLQVPGVAKVMPRNRFIKNSQYLHLSDFVSEPNRTDPNRDRLYKVRPIIDLVRKTFPEHFYPFKEISVDEAMCKFKGRSHMIQYMPGKPVKWGFKIWSVACPRTGYTFDMSPYTGKKSTPEKGLGYQVVCDLTQQYFYFGHHIYYDNFFSSVQIALDLYSKDTYICSTIRKNSKGLPGEIKNSVKMKQGDYIVRQSQKVVACTWYDKREVRMLTTNCSPGGRDVTRGGKTFFTPFSVLQYNQYMGGVDLSDQLASYYSISKKYMKYWKYLFFFFIQRMIVNSFILYSIAHSPNPRRRYRQLDFRLDLSSQLIAGYCSRKKTWATTTVTWC